MSTKYKGIPPIPKLQEGKHKLGSIPVVHVMFLKQNTYY